MWALIIVIAVLLVWLGALTWKHQELRAQFIEVVTRVPIVGGKGPTADAVWLATAARIMKTKVTIQEQPGWAAALDEGLSKPGHAKVASAEQRAAIRLPDPRRACLIGASLLRDIVRHRGLAHGGEQSPNEAECWEQINALEKAGRAPARSVTVEHLIEEIAAVVDVPPPDRDKVRRLLLDHVGAEVIES